MRFAVNRNFVFVPWDEDYQFEDNGIEARLVTPDGVLLPWMVKEPTR